MDFYADIATRYDEIVGTAARADDARRFVDRLFDHCPFKRALDVACGTGLYARAMAGTGGSVVAADISQAMLDQARSLGHNDRIKWVHAPMQDIAAHVTGRFDAIVCMGNSIPHLLSDDDLPAACEAFASVAADGAAVVVQLLNYKRILDRRERIVGASRHGDSEYVRFYDFMDPLVRFNVLELRWHEGLCEHSLHQTTLRPYTPEELEAGLTRAGLGSIKSFGGLDLETPYTCHSDQVVLLARQG